MDKEAAPAIPTLIEMYKSKNSMDHGIANSVLQDIGPDAIPPLVELLKDKDPRVRLIGVEALEYLQPHDPAAIAEAWIGALNDTDSGVRASAARKLSDLAKGWRVKVPEIVSALTTALKDSDEEVRTNAAWSLWWLGEARVAEPVLKELVRSKNPNTRRFAELALKEMK